MLKWKPTDRAKARDLLNHRWLSQPDDYNVWMSKRHLKEYKIVNRDQFPGYLEELAKEKEREEAKAKKAAEKQKKKEEAKNKHDS